MAADILITLPIAALFVLIALRCLYGFGWQPAGLEKAFPAGGSPLLRRTGTPPRGGRSLPWPWGCGCSCSRPASAGCGSSPARPCPWGRRCSPCAAGTPPHYINLAEQGYDGYVENGQHLFLVFYPAYVWLLRAARVLIPHTLLAGMLHSSLCYAGAAALCTAGAAVLSPRRSPGRGGCSCPCFPSPSSSAPP